MFDVSGKGSWTDQMGSLFPAVLAPQFVYSAEKHPAGSLSVPVGVTAAGIIRNPQRQFKNDHKVFLKKYKIHTQRGLKNKQTRNEMLEQKSERGKELEGKVSSGASCRR